MIHEYALDPEAVLLWRDRATQQLVLEAFRSGSGRVPACLPAKWARQVYDAYKEADQNERKRLEVFVEALIKRKSQRAATVWNSQARGWVENILLEHETRPFRAIVTPHTVEKCCEAIGTELELDSPAWAVPRTVSIPRTGEALAAAVAPMLFASRNVIIVDPVFRPVQRFYAPISHLMQACAKPGSTTTVQILMGQKSRDPPWANMMERDCDRLARFVPRGVILEVVYVPVDRISERLHNRFILTDIGGVMVLDSIDEGEPGHSNDLGLMDHAHFQLRQAEARMVIQSEPLQRKTIRRIES